MDFFETPNFSVNEVNGDDVLSFLSTDKERAAWRDYYLSNPCFLYEVKDSRIRYMFAQKRFSFFKDLIDLHPFLSLMLADSLFWLSDFDGCLQHLHKLYSQLPDSEQLCEIIAGVKKIADEERVNDEFYFATGGLEGNFAVVPFSSTFGCPFLVMDTEEIEKIVTNWKDVQKYESSALQCFHRLACLASNILEDVFELDRSSWTRLIRSGFYRNSIEGISKTSREKKKEKIIQILKNTENALSLVSSCLDDYTRFTSSFLKQLHESLFHNDWFVEEQINEEDFYGNPSCVIRLMKVGEFRTVACCTSHGENDSTELTQYCHHAMIPAEIESFCVAVQDLLAQGEMDPFMKAAWIQWAFLRIHPFEDGNGRASRIISSLPLYKFHLPPIVVKKEQKTEYFKALKAADKETNLSLLRDLLKDSLVDGINDIRTLPKQPAELKTGTRKRRIPGTATKLSGEGSGSSASGSKLG
jgi:fido (protein-threonine AMPylation protein)